MLLKLNISCLFTEQRSLKGIACFFPFSFNAKYTNLVLSSIKFALDFFGGNIEKGKQGIGRHRNPQIWYFGK
jgi:hypothetical protein